MRSNNGPRVVWLRAPLACGIVRHRLSVQDKETPFFVDDCRSAGRAHQQAGDPVSLYASGRGQEVRTRSGGRYPIAAAVQGFRNVGLAKATAERMALREIEA